MCEVGSPTVEGQSVQAEDHDGQRWSIECLGEPVEVGDRIAFQALGLDEGRRGEMLRLLDGPRSGWVCTIHRHASGIRLTPFGGVDIEVAGGANDDPRSAKASHRTASVELSLSDSDSKEAPDGTRVLVARIARDAKATRKTRAKRDGRRRAARIPVRVVEVLGPAHEPDSDHRALAWKHRLPTGFSRRARLESNEIEAGLSASEIDRRLDLRHLPFITIDPASARDHDDAVFAERRKDPSVELVSEAGGHPPNARRAPNPTWEWRLWVAIADVSHFVVAGGWIDAEARRRGNSFYFPDRSIPMLPERLSSDLCSLRSGADRLAIVAELRMTSRGEVADALFHEAVIRSHAGLSYEEAAAWLETRESKPAWGESLACLGEIAAKLSRARAAAGALSLELPEVEIKVDATGRPVDARLRARNPAHGLIEEAMLSANRAVATALEIAQRETIHRSHPAPSAQKLAALSALLERLGISVDGELEDPGVLAKLLTQVKGDPSEERIHIAVLRSMSQARYEPVSSGHYALRFEHYAHFTSPIRRYADLEVHRALKAMIRGEPAQMASASQAQRSASRLAIWLSGRERVAVEVEREAEAMASCALLSGREGERFAATVTGATEFGCFIRLDSPSASGLVPMRAIGSAYRHDPDEDALIADRSGHRIGPGDRLDVELTEVDPDRARLTFVLAQKHRRARS